MEAATVLEDAMSTATLPGADDGRWVLVRRLGLGALPAQAPALADRVRDEVRTLYSRGCHAASAGAEHAPLVWFDDVVQAWALLLDGLLAGRQLDAWFWRLVVPWTPAPPPLGEAIERAFLEIAETDVGVWGGATLLRELAEATRLERVLESVSPVGGARIARRYGISSTVQLTRPSSRQRAATPPDTGEPTVLLPRLETRWAPLRRAVVAAVIEDRPLPIWAVGLAMIVESPQLAGRPTLPPLVATTVDAMVRAESVEVTEGRPERTEHTERVATSDRTVHAFEPVAPSPDRSEEPPSLTAEVGASLASTGGRDTGDATAADASPDVAPREEMGEATGEATARQEMRTPPETWTEVGGLWFLVRVFGTVRGDLQLPMTESVFGDFPRHVLARWASQVGVPEDDPAWQLLQPSDELTDAWAVRLAEVVAAGESWLQTALPQRDAPLASVVWRPARLLVSRTHLDVWFTLDQADVELRRLGLDLDPGWVPWLGRIVSFHYGEA